MVQKRLKVCHDSESDNEQNQPTKRLKVCHDSESDNEQNQPTAIEVIIQQLKREKPRCALLAIINSQQFNTALLANKDRCSLGRLCFTQNKFMMRNIDSACIMCIHCRINKRAFDYYYCRSKKVTVECCLETLCKHVEGKQKDGVYAVISVPNSTEETGFYGPISFRYVNTVGLRETTTITIPKIILDMPYLNKREINYVFDFCMACGHLQRVLSMLKSDTTADTMRITVSAERVIFNNENGDSTVPIKISVPSDGLDYSFDENLAGADSFSILVSRPRIISMLSLKGINQCSARLRGLTEAFNLSYMFNNDEGFVEFIISNKVMPDDYYA